VRVGEADFDGGPTLMMMLEPFTRLFADLGERLEDHLDISLCDPSYRVFYRGGTRIDGTPNVARMVRQIEAMSGRKDAENYAVMLGDLAALYRDSIPNFVRRNWDSPLQAAPKVGTALRRGMLRQNLYKGISAYVDDPRLRQLFSFQTMYLGLSPFDSPWVYAVLTYMEYGEGIWYPKGGLVEISNVVARLAQARGAEIRLNAPVASVEGTSVCLESGERIEVDHVVMNADLPYAERALLGRGKAEDRRRYSCSAYLLYIDYAGDLPNLEHHNVFFGNDFEDNLDAIFHRRECPTDPAFYACVSSKTDPQRALPGHSNLFLLIPCANLDRPWSEEDATALKEVAFARLREEVGFDPSRIAEIRAYTPNDWAGELNLERGAAFGLSHDFLQSAFFRPNNRVKAHPGLTYVGASTVPGNGLPMVLISAELAQQRVEQALQTLR
jgi:phytoene desaturase